MATLGRRNLEGPLINLYVCVGEKQLHVSLHNTGSQDLDAEAITWLAFDHQDTVGMPPRPLARERAWAMQSLIRTYGKGLTGVVVAFVTFWIIVMIVVPQLRMIERGVGITRRPIQVASKALGCLVEPAEIEPSCGAFEPSVIMA